VICLDADALEIAASPSTDLPSIACPDNLAYIIYTSGTTGRPKAVCIPHRSAFVFVEWAASVFDAEELSGVVASTSFCFDLSIFELFVPLSLGGTVILARNALSLPEKGLAQPMRLLNTVPSAAEALTHAGIRWSDFRTVNLAGEPLTARLADLLYQAGVRKVYDLYGPSECTTYSTCALRRPGAAATIGRPIEGTYIVLLDRDGQPVPAGVPGEIHIGGEGLARGYLNRPDATAERFVPNAYSKVSGARLYRTGDLARVGSDGQLEFLGRNDRQLKIRGYRIEPGEIESMLHEHPAVRHAVVNPYRDPRSGAMRLAAYIVARDGGMAVNEIRRYLSSRAPAYMVPDDIIELPALPLTPNGKLDRRALPEPGRPDVSRKAEAPVTEVEQLVSQLWGELLGGEPSSPQAGFFESGGDSLLAVRLLARIRAVLGVDLALRTIFEAGTISGLASAIDAARRADGAQAAPPIRATGRTAGPLTYTQTRLWLMHQLDPTSAAYNQFGAVLINGPLDAERLRRAVAFAVERHAALRTVFAQEGTSVVQRVLPVGAVPLPEVDLTSAQKSERLDLCRRLITDFGEQPFDIESLPFRSLLVRLSSDEHVLAFSIHHLVCDGWSARVLLEDLWRAYEGSQTPPPSIQLIDYALWEQERSSDPSAEIDYWTKQLRGATPELPLPLDRPRTSRTAARGASVAFQVDPGTSAALRDLCAVAGVTPMMLMLAAFKVVLREWCCHDDIVVGSPFANRRRRETHDLVGPLVNTIVLRTDLSGDPTFRECLHRVRETVLSAEAHQELSFDRLLAAVQSRRRPGCHPLFQVWYVYDRASELATGDLKLSPLFVTRREVRHDLKLAVTDHRDRFVGAFEYRASLFDDSTIRELAARFEHLLAAISRAAVGTV
jgi:amino acid adenylation domain-containing protein